MSVEPVDQTTDTAMSDRGDVDLSRRGFLACFAMLGAAGAAAATMRPQAANAAAAIGLGSPTQSRTEPEHPANGKTVELAQNVDPNDPLQSFNQPYYRHRRRVVRRTVRRNYRYSRRVHRRVRRAVY
jgi:hypothetical protein